VLFSIISLVGLSFVDMSIQEGRKKIQTSDIRLIRRNVNRLNYFLDIGVEFLKGRKFSWTKI
jgi:hypothetical protein